MGGSRRAFRSVLSLLKMREKKSHFGMAGHFAAMSEFLLRGWNVAVPFVDVGDDVLVLEDAAATIYRVQVKSADGEERRRAGGNIFTYGQLDEKDTHYTLSRAQLATAKDVELFYMLMVRWKDEWRFLLIDRATLADLRKQFVDTPREGRTGRPPVDDNNARNDNLALHVTWTRDGASAWNANLKPYVDSWPKELEAPQVDDPT